MTIENKYNLGDEVIFFEYYGARFIKKIITSVIYSEREIRYWFSNVLIKWQEEVFSSLEEAKESVIEMIKGRGIHVDLTQGIGISNTWLYPSTCD